MKYIINEMIDEFNQEIQREYQKLHSDISVGQFSTAVKTSATIKTLQSSISLLQTLLARIEATETQC